jgi:hypothetical protein
MLFDPDLAPALNARVGLTGEPAGGPLRLFVLEQGDTKMNRFDWTFSGSAELVTGLLLLALIIVAAFA